MFGLGGMESYEVLRLSEYKIGSRAGSISVIDEGPRCGY